MNNQKGGSIVIGYLDLLLLSSILSVAIFGNQISKEESVKRSISSREENIKSEGDYTSMYNRFGKAARSVGDITGKSAKLVYGKTKQGVINTGKYIEDKREKNIEQDRIDKTNVLTITDYFFRDNN